MKKLIVRIAEGLGNQMFMYAHAYALSKKLKYELFVDNTSGYFKTKNQIRVYQLDRFNINANLSDNSHRFDNNLSDLKRKIFKKFDLFKANKKFLIEDVETNKLTYFKDYTNRQYSDLFFVEGYFQSEKYFYNYSNDLKEQFKIKSGSLRKNNKYIQLLNSSNSVSICVRQNRYSEGKIMNNEKSSKFTLDTINYIKKSVIYIKDKLTNPKFFVWSNDFSGLNEHFNTNEFTFIHNDENKSLNDFDLFQYSKHFIVGPTPFHWWGAWLNNNPNKICLRPANINPSNNKDFWPEKWKSI